MRISPSFRILAILVLTAAVICAAEFSASPELWKQVAILGFAAVLLIHKLDYVHPITAYLVPWLAILFFTKIPVSDLAVRIEDTTYLLLIVTMLTWVAGVSTAEEPRQRGDRAQLEIPRRSIAALAYLCWGIFAIEVFLSGFIPLASALTTGDSRYLDFGIGGLHGAWCAFAGAIACLSWYSYRATGEKRYLVYYASVWVMFGLLLTRQNMLMILAETLIISALTGKRLSRRTMAIVATCVVLAFSALGQLRGIDIASVIQVNAEYRDWPVSVFWLYGYSYFNVMNLQNTIFDSGAPFYDGSMWASLLPSFLRPTIDHGTYLTTQALNVSSYMATYYTDVGAVGLVLMTLFWGVVTGRAYKRGAESRDFVSTATYACLYYCAVMSFFTDLWLALPVIFQIVFFWYFSKRIFSGKEKAFRATAAA